MNTSPASMISAKLTPCPDTPANVLQPCSLPLRHTKCGGLGWIDVCVGDCLLKAHTDAFKSCTRTNLAVACPANRRRPWPLWQRGRGPPSGLFPPHWTGPTRSRKPRFKSRSRSGRVFPLLAFLQRLAKIFTTQRKRHGITKSTSDKRGSVARFY